MSKNQESLSDGHYTPAEEASIFESWGNQLCRSNPELAQELVRMMIDNTAEEDSQ